MLNQFYSKLARSLAALLCFAALSAHAASREDSDFQHGTNLFASAQAGGSPIFYHQAEMTFRNFIVDYTNSPLLTNAIIYYARSKLGQSNYVGALELMREKLPPNDPTVLKYIAQAYYGAGDYTNAAASCATLLGKLTAGDPSVLGAAGLQAQAEAKLRDWPRVISLLSSPDGVFQRAARGDPANIEVVNGTFLLSEAFLNEQRFDEAESAVRQAKTNSLSRALQWRRDYLLCRILFEAGRTEDALTNSVELDAFSTGPSDAIATTFLRGEIFERLNQPATALAEYKKNLAPALPPDVNRKALTKIMALAQPAETIPQLDAIIARRPFDPNLDLALWYRGDLYLKNHFAPVTPDTNSPAAANTNDLQAAITNLTWLVRDFTNSEVLGHAALDLGWCDWTQEKFVEAKTNFLLAVQHLPYSEEGAVALFKLADAQFKQGDFADAARHYDQLLTDYAAMPAVTNQLLATALYQLVQADVNLHEEKGAEQAANRLINDYRDSGFGASSLLLLSESSSRLGDYARAREGFANLLAAYPNTPQPKIQFAIAHTYEHEGDWSNAVRICEIWLGNTNFATNELLPEVNFTLALDSGKAGLETNALALMTSYVTQFQSNSLASNTLAPQAQFWIGDYYRNHGENATAHSAYENVWLKFHDATNLTFPAHLMAGRAAESYDLRQASNDFRILTEDTNTPAPILGQAWFHLGYVDFLQFQASLPKTTNIALFRNAVDALGYATNSTLYPTLAPEALGQLGNCWLAWAPLDVDPADKAKHYAIAAQAYQAELNLPQSDITARSQGECGLGLVEQDLHHPIEALDHFLKVVFPPSEVLDEAKEKPDPVWVKEAGVAAWQMCEDKKDYAGATNIYARVKAVVPTLNGEMEEKKTAAAAPPTSGH
jgi:TolA-binding protein